MPSPSLMDPTLLTLLTSILNSLRQLAVVKADVQTLTSNVNGMNIRLQTEVRSLNESVLGEIAEVEKVAMDHIEDIETQLSAKLRDAVGSLTTDINRLRGAICKVRDEAYTQVQTVDRKHDGLIAALQTKQTNDTMVLSAEIADLKKKVGDAFTLMQTSIKLFSDTIARVAI